MNIKPAPGRAVRFPGTFRLLDAAGEDVTLTPYWYRLLAAGDVIAVPTPPAATPRSPSKKEDASS